MKVTFWLPIIAGLLAGGLNAATITYEVAPLGGNNYQYIYSVNGVTFSANQGFDIRFDPTIFTSISNAAGPSGYNFFLLQPNNPPGANGDFEAVATVNGPANSPFTINVTTNGPAPGSQSFSIDTFGPGGSITSVTQSGTTAAVPEPSTWFPVLALLAVGAIWRLRSLRSSTRLSIIAAKQ